MKEMTQLINVTHITDLNTPIFNDELTPCATSLRRELIWCGGGLNTQIRFADLSKNKISYENSFNYIYIFIIYEYLCISMHVNLI